MDDRSVCPSETALRDLLIGRLPEDEALQISMHVENCARCEQFLEQFRDTAPATVGVSLEISFPPADPLAATRSQPSEYGALDQFASSQARFDPSVMAPSERPNSLGRLGKYDVMREIGHGGYGVVFEGWDEQLRRAVAIKVLSRELNTSPVARRRFLREARAAAAINHPNVVTIHAVEEHNGFPFLVMELVNGGSLRDWVRSGPKPNIFDVLRIGFQIASGLAAAHSQGVIHRDIKPANILLVNGLERIKISDFGLARVTVENVDLTSREIAVGTPTYMSPEQVVGASIDVRSDLFSLGCVLYAMFVGHSPFQGRTALDVARKIVDEMPSPLHIVDPSVPRFMSDIVHRLLAKSPDERFQSAAELTELIQHYLVQLNQTPSDELDATLHAASYEKPKKSRRGWKKAGAAGGVIMCCVGLVSLIWFLTMNKRGTDHRESTKSRSSSATQVAPRHAALDVVRVGKSQNSRVNCSTLNDALELVKPGGTIRVVDGETYDEAIVLHDPERWRGVQIIADKAALLTSRRGGTIVTLSGVPEVVVRGFRMQLPNDQRGFEITGDSRGVTIENIQVQSLTAGGGDPLGFLYIHDGAAGSETQPIIVRHLTLSDRRNAIVIGEQELADPARPVRWCLLEHCKFLGPATPSGYRCVLFGGIEHIVIRRCLITQAECAFSVAAGSGNQIEWLRNVTIQNCTLHGIDSWLRWKVSPSASERILWQNNLLLKTASMDVQAESAKPDWFINNWWEVGGSLPLNAGLVADTFADLPVLSTDPASPDYLKLDVDRLGDAVRADAIIPGMHALSQ